MALTPLAPLTAPTMPEGIRHGFFTRKGGVSGGIYNSLNVGRGSQDDPAHIEENRRRVCAHLQAETLITAYQSHSTAVALIDDPTQETPKADALITQKRGIAIGALSADCVPILLADKKAQWVATIHAGWRGACDGIIETTLSTLYNMGAKPTDIIAAIGPAISATAYEVDIDFATHFQNKHPSSADLFTPIQDNHCFFDLPAFVAHTLQEAGLHPHNQNICTYGNEDLFFSYRRACHRGEADYGRAISAICIK